MSMREVPRRPNGYKGLIPNTHPPIDASLHQPNRKDNMSIIFNSRPQILVNSNPVAAAMDSRHVTRTLKTVRAPAKIPPGYMQKLQDLNPLRNNLKSQRQHDEYIMRQRGPSLSIQFDEEISQDNYLFYGITPKSQIYQPPVTSISPFSTTLNLQDSLVHKSVWLRDVLTMEFNKHRKDLLLTVQSEFSDLSAEDLSKFRKNVSYMLEIWAMHEGVDLEELLEHHLLIKNFNRVLGTSQTRPSVIIAGNVNPLQRDNDRDAALPSESEHTLSRTTIKFLKRLLRDILERQGITNEDTIDQLLKTTLRGEDQRQTIQTHSGIPISTVGHFCSDALQHIAFQISKRKQSDTAELAGFQFILPDILPVVGDEILDDEHFDSNLGSKTQKREAHTKDLVKSPSETDSLLDKSKQKVEDYTTNNEKLNFVNSETLVDGRDKAMPANLSLARLVTTSTHPPRQKTP